MAFLHCHDCEWQQDDFWDLEDYNPLMESFIADLRCNLFKDEIRLNCETMTGRDFVARELRRIVQSIESMSVPTLKEWQVVKADWVCPKCGSKNWDID